MCKKLVASLVPVLILFLVTALTGCAGVFSWLFDDNQSNKNPDDPAIDTVASLYLDNLVLALTGSSGRSLTSGAPLSLTDAVSLRTYLTTCLNTAQIQDESLTAIANTLAAGICSYIEGNGINAGTAATILEVAVYSLISTGTEASMASRLEENESSEEYIVSTAAIIIDKAKAIDSAQPFSALGGVMENLTKASLESSAILTSTTPLVVVSRVLDATMADLDSSLVVALAQGISAAAVKHEMGEQDFTAPLCVLVVIKAATMEDAEALRSTVAVIAGSLLEYSTDAAKASSLTQEILETSLANEAIGATESAANELSQGIISAVLSGEGSTGLVEPLISATVQAVINMLEEPEAVIANMIVAVEAAEEPAESSPSTQAITQIIGDSVGTNIEGRYTLGLINPPLPHWDAMLIELNTMVTTGVSRFEIFQDKIEVVADMGAGPNLMWASVVEKITRNGMIYLLVEWKSHVDPGTMAHPWMVFQIGGFGTSRAFLVADIGKATKTAAQALYGTNLNDTAPYAYKLIRVSQ